MSDELARIVHSGSEEDVTTELKKFNVQNAQNFNFPDLNKDTKKSMIEGILFRLNGIGSNTLYLTCLESIRIIVREKSGLETITNDAGLKTLLKHSGLDELVEESDRITVHNDDYTIMIEAQKCLCNLIFNSPQAQKICSTNGCVDGIVRRLKTYKDPELPYDIKFYDMRMLFLITALVRDIREHIRQDLHGFIYLIEVLDLCLTDWGNTQTPLTDQHVDLSCEVLKILFNVTVSLDRANMDEEEEAHFLRLVSILHDLLVCTTVSKHKADDLKSHTVNLLTNVPRNSYEELLTPLVEGTVGSLDNKDVEYDGKNMEAINALLDFLEHRLDSPVGNMKESLTPLLLCFCEICRSHRVVRKYCRVKILPYLRNEALALPEEGTALRNKLCKLLTNPVMEVKDLAADFLFVLCKESVTRFVKYTGYGNAAGLLAQRGLMCGGRGAEYSSESEDSDTEEYSNLRSGSANAGINPITGRWEEERPDPMAGMSDEQKEYEAEQLIKHIDKLHRSGVIQPSIVGPDGRPRPVAHILELTDGVNPGDGTANSDSD